MSYFKRFTDFLAGVGIFSGVIFLVSKYMTYEPKLIDEGASKLSEFFSRLYGNENRYYLFLVLLLFASAVLGRFLAKLPVICLAISFLPFLHVMNMLFGDRLSSQPMLYLAVAVLHFFGNFYECICRDKDDASDLSLCGNRAFWACGLMGAIASVASAAGVYFIDKYTGEYDAFFEGTFSDEKYEIYQRFDFFGIKLIANFEAEDAKALRILAVMLVISLILSLVWRGVYFLDAATAAVPFAYMLYIWHKGMIFPNAMAIVLSVSLYFFCRLLVLFSGSAYKKRRSISACI